MDASCKIQGSIHVFRLVNIMCPGKWVHIILEIRFLFWFYRFLRRFRTVFLISRSDSDPGCCIDS